MRDRGRYTGLQGQQRKVELENRLNEDLDKTILPQFPDTIPDYSPEGYDERATIPQDPTHDPVESESEIQRWRVRDERDKT